MGISSIPPGGTRHSEQNIANWGFDDDFSMPMTELVAYDPLANALKRVTTNAMGEYQTNDIEESGTVTYIGKEDSGGDWYIQKIDTTSGTSIRYATVKNNVTITNYTDAWSIRATTLTYGTYSQAF